MTIMAFHSLTILDEMQTSWLARDAPSAQALNRKTCSDKLENGGAAPTGPGPFFLVFIRRGPCNRLGTAIHSPRLRPPSSQQGSGFGWADSALGWWKCWHGRNGGMVNWRIGGLADWRTGWRVGRRDGCRYPRDCLSHALSTCTLCLVAVDIGHWDKHPPAPVAPQHRFSS